jgi:hypothetical protein
LPRGILREVSEKYYNFRILEWRCPNKIPFSSLFSIIICGVGKWGVNDALEAAAKQYEPYLTP